MKLWHLCVAGGTLVVLFILLLLFGINFEYSSGSRAGIVTKFSKKGYAFKTYEGS